MSNIAKSPEVDVIFDFVKELKPKNVLEVGCNFGRELKHLEGLSSLYGIDVDTEKIQKAKTYVHGIFKVAEASYIPYKDNKFDFIYSSGVFAHSPPEKIKEILKELFRASNKYILLVEYVGSRQSMNSVGNCKKNTWIHDYELLTSTLEVNVKYNQKKFFGTDCFQVILMEKMKNAKSINRFFIESPQIPSRFIFKLGKFKIEVK